MPDLMDFAIVRNGTVSLPNAPTWKITGRIVDSQDQSIEIRDFTGASAVNFPQVLGQFSNAQQDDFVQEVVMSILRRRFGI